MTFEAVIGLEVHAQLLTSTKLFCGCSTRFEASVNENICPVCTGMPGVLPVLNKTAVECTTKMALATHCKINNRSQFARKNYFYPDLPKGYQISQYERPIAEHGFVFIRVGGEEKKIGITRIHMEEDAGKSIHHAHSSALNFNRAGIPLIEIVSEPELKTPEEASAYMRSLRDILLYLDICDCNMEEGNIRCDANISVRLAGEKEFGTKSEIKNLNSFKFLERALAYEIERQIGVIESGGKVPQETRLWDSGKQKTFSMRTKESAHDYRYFPDPDLLPVIVEQEWVEEIKRLLPELPEEKRDRFIKEYGVSSYDAGVLTSSKVLADYFERAVKDSKSPKLVCNWVCSELLGKLNENNLEIASSPVSADNIRKLVSLIEQGEISGKIAKSVFEEMFATQKEPSVVIAEKGLKQIMDPSEIGGIIDQIIADNKGQVDQYRGGKTRVFAFFVGQVMKITQGRANPELVNRLLQEKLKG